VSSKPKTLTTWEMGETEDHRPQPGSIVAFAARTEESRCKERFVMVETGEEATVRGVVERSRAVHPVVAGQRVPRPLQIENPFPFLLFNSVIDCGGQACQHAA
jgi:hypothetical protein